jgi:hypothetical protein
VVVRNPAPSEDQAFIARLQYLSSVSDRVTAIMNSADRFVNFAGIIAAATITAGILGKDALIAILAPYALMIIFTYQIQLYTDAERFIVLLEHLEARLNASMHENVFRTKSVLDRAYRKRLSTTYMQKLYAIALLASIVVSCIKTYLSFGWPWLLADVVCATTIATFLLGAAGRELQLAQGQVEVSLAAPANPHEKSSADKQPIHTPPVGP